MTDLLKELVSEDGCYVHRRVFADEQLYQLEKRHIFSRNWLYIAHESQLREPGDFVSTYMGETPVIVARGDDDAVHVSINSCTHRGVPVCRADQGKAKRFVCPYHAWMFSVDGRLLGVPQETKVCSKVDKASLGLKKVPRVDSYNGLIFACLDPDVKPLSDFLGDMRWYLDCFFDRFENGVEVIGAPHKWSIKANWKLPVENQLGDVGHAPFLHGSLMQGTEAVDIIKEHGHNVVPRPGHGVAVRLLPKGTPPETVMWGSDGIAVIDPEVASYLREEHIKVEARLGPVRARLSPLCYSIYPNFSFLWANLTIRQAHPKGPGEMEYWSWFVVDKGAPDSIKEKLRSNYTFFFGPGGVLEQEDAEAWSQQYLGSTIDYADDRTYYYGLGIDDPKNHPELPGDVGSCYDEHYAREFYLRWQRELIAGEDQ